MNISFSKTTAQFRARTKTVTRRTGWHKLKTGQILVACEKCQGLKKGERVVKLGRIRVISHRWEPLRRMVDEPEYGRQEVVREGFPDMSPAEFVEFFCKFNRCEPEEMVNRIEFAYMDDSPDGGERNE